MITKKEMVEWNMKVHSDISFRLEFFDKVLKNRYSFLQLKSRFQAIRRYALISFVFACVSLKTIDPTP